MAKLVTETLSIPTIGIGAGRFCDGQVLVFHDLLGIYEDMRPKFVKRFAEIGKTAVSALQDYDRELKNGSFPTEEHIYAIDDEIINVLKK